MLRPALATIVLLAATAWLAGCTGTEQNPPPHETSSSAPVAANLEIPMMPIDHGTSSSLHLPPIDAAAPRHFETATFALG